MVVSGKPGASQEQDAPVNLTWSISELRDELERFEQEARLLAPDALMRTHVDRSRVFVRWLEGNPQFQGPP